jgi:hypothetical protein
MAIVEVSRNAAAVTNACAWYSVCLSERTTDSSGGGKLGVGARCQRNAIISCTIENTEEIPYTSYDATAKIVTAWTREGAAAEGGDRTTATRKPQCYWRFC